MTGETIGVVAGVMTGLDYYLGGSDAERSKVAPIGGWIGRPQHRPGAQVAMDMVAADLEQQPFTNPQSPVIPRILQRPRPGEPPCKTLLWVNVLRRYRTRNFPVEDASAGCGGALCVVVQVGAARCAAVLDEYGNPPDAAVMEREALMLLDDADRLEAALCRAAGDLESGGLVNQTVIGGWEPIGPMGGITSGVMTAWFEIAGKA